MDQDILQLVQSAKEKNSEAFRELYDLFAQRLYRFIVLKVQDHKAAEDILQETFIKAWQGLPALPLHNLRFSAWMFKIAANCINDYFRQKYRRPALSELEEAADVASSDDVAERLAVQADVETVKSALARLPASYRQILELRFVQDFTLSESARILGKSRITVGVLQYRALKKLKNILGDGYVLGY